MLFSSCIYSFILSFLCVLRWMWVEPMRVCLMTNSLRWLARLCLLSRMNSLPSAAMPRSGLIPTRAWKRPLLDRYHHTHTSSMQCTHVFVCIYTHTQYLTQLDSFSCLLIQADFLEGNMGSTNMKGFVMSLQKRGKVHHTILVEQVRVT